MIVYHGSTIIVKNPDISYSKRFLDFGKGFYVTAYQNQAEKWAARKGLRQGTKGIVNQYILIVGQIPNHRRVTLLQNE